MFKNPDMSDLPFVTRQSSIYVFLDALASDGSSFGK
jgi:hypothetical protein